MASFTKAAVAKQDIGIKVHNFDTDVFKVMASNATPTGSESLKADVTEISAGNGYSTGGVTLPNTNYAGGILTGDKGTITAAGGSVGPFRYLWLYNDTAPGKPLLGYWDYGSAYTIASGQPFDIKPSNADTGGEILRIS